LPCYPNISCPCYPSLRFNLTLGLGTKPLLPSQPVPRFSPFDFSCCTRVLLSSSDAWSSPFHRVWCPRSEAPTCPCPLRTYFLFLVYSVMPWFLFTYGLIIGTTHLAFRTFSLVKFLCHFFFLFRGQPRQNCTPVRMLF